MFPSFRHRAPLRLASLVLICSPGLAQVTFFLSPGEDPNGDLAWQAAAGGAPIVELDFEQFSPGTYVPSLEFGYATAAVQLLNNDGSVNGKEASTAWSVEFDVPDVMWNIALLNGTSPLQGLPDFKRPHLRLTFSRPVLGFGTWIFDDDFSQHQFILHVETLDGQTTSSPVFDSGGIDLHIEGFLGAISSTGISSVVIELQDLNGNNTQNFFELDHVQVALLAPVGNNYCGPGNPNSTGQPAVIHAYGSDQAGGNPLVLEAVQMPANQFGYFLASQTQGFVQNPGGSQGNLCLGGTIGRFVDQVQKSGPAGGFSISVDTLHVPQAGMDVAIQPGETWSFQAWHRDGTTSNFTDGLAITFQ